ncbi:sigma factor-like helix-turn-helix DNA-binding protein [Rhizobium helianthi]|uniref:Sigma factor-like helix-turn-helix DNA-binding protein n=1 Tax=Rhizobium helianthi TaxID=1132695 RepID=A0ABW4MA19_9HYPH
MDARSNSSDMKRDLVALLPRLRRFALVLTQNTARADELVSKVCEHALLKAPFQDGEDRLDLRLFGATCTLWRTDIRKKKPSCESAAALRGATAAPASAASGMPVALSAELAAAFLLCAVEGLSYREAAAVMATTEDSIAETLLAARRELAILMPINAERKAR